jgi:hypothetical protein
MIPAAPPSFGYQHLRCSSDVTAVGRGGIKIKHAGAVEVAIDAADLEHTVFGRGALSPGYF